MKKLFIIIALFMSSFFLFNFKVNASTDHIIKDYSLVLSEDFLDVKSKAKALFESLEYQNYVILSNSTGSNYYVWFFNNDYVTFKSIYSSGYFYSISFTNVTNARYNYDSINKELVLYQEYTYSPDFSLQYNYILYSTVDVKFKYYSNPGTFNYSLPDFSKSYSSSSDDDSLFPTVYEVCVSSGNCTEDYDPTLIHKEEIEKLNNFYTICIEKISYLASFIVGNYIFLSIFVIFIFIFVFELIRRRFL